MKDIKRVLGIDPALRHLGIIEGNLKKRELSITKAVTYETKSRKKKKSILSDGEHDVYCSAYLAKSVSSHILEFKPDLICAEIGSGTLSYGAAMALGAMKGFIGGLIAQHSEYQWVIVTPYQAKLIVSKNADKNEIMAWVLKNNKEYKFDKAKCRFEHQADAVIIALAGINKFLNTGV